MVIPESDKNTVATQVLRINLSDIAMNESARDCWALKSPMNEDRLLKWRINAPRIDHTLKAPAKQHFHAIHFIVDEH